MDREELSKRRFTQDEIGELIETASRLDQLSLEKGLTYDELRRVALELGISEEALARAVAQEQEAQRAAEEQREAVREAERKRHKRRRKEINEWKAHAASYVAVICGLGLIDWISGGGFDWFFYPAAGWGIGFLVHTFNVLFRIDS